MSDYRANTGTLCGIILHHMNDSNETQEGSDALLVKRVAYLYITPLVILLGVIGDLLTICVLNNQVLKRSVLYVYLTVLAFTDLCAEISVIPMILWLAEVKRCERVFATYYARFGFPLVNAFLCASVWVVVFLTLSQYEAICHPFSRRFKSTATGYCMAGLAYLLSFSIHVPYTLQKSAYNASQVNYECGFVACDNLEITTSKWYLIYQWIREAISRLVPFLLICYFNVRILIAYRRSQTERAAAISRTQQQILQEKSEREERRLVLFLVAIVSLFFVCTIPAAVLAILINDGLTDNAPFQVVRALINMLEFSKFALNFYFYCMINPDIRTICLDLILCRRRERARAVTEK